MKQKHPQRNKRTSYSSETLKKNRKKARPDFSLSSSRSQGKPPRSSRQVESAFAGRAPHSQEKPAPRAQQADFAFSASPSRGQGKLISRSPHADFSRSLGAFEGGHKFSRRSALPHAAFSASSSQSRFNFSPFLPKADQKSKPSSSEKGRALLRRLPMFDEGGLSSACASVLERFDEAASSACGFKASHLRELPKSVRDLSFKLTSERGERRAGYMNDARARAAYINYFLWWNLERLCGLFCALPAECFPLDDGDAAVDLGSGPLTVVTALWLSRRELRKKRLTFYCVDRSQAALSAGEDIFLSVTARTIEENECQWKIVRVKGEIGTRIRQKAKLVTCANVLDELADFESMPADFLAKKYASFLLSYADTDEHSRAGILLIEPGEPRSSRLVSLVRDALIRRGFEPLSPCPHSSSCPMAGKVKSNPNGKWCNFAFKTDKSPSRLLALSRQSGLRKERASLSFVFAMKAQKQRDSSSQTEEDLLKLRVASDEILLPRERKKGYYACSKKGLVLLIDEGSHHLQNGDLIALTPDPKEDTPSEKDAKTGALIIRIR